MSIDRDRQAANVTNRRLFSPLSPEQEIYVENREKVRSDLYNLIKIHEPKCCFVELMEGKKLNQKVKQGTPSSLTDRVKLFKYNDKVTVAQNVSNFTDSIKLTDRQIDIIKQNTVGQALVDEWFKQREGSLTASRFHQICTRVDSLQASKSNDPTNLISTLLGYKSVPETAAMKHGKAMEPHAKSSYLSIVKRKHRKFRSNEAGLVIMNDKQFIGVSPDLEIDCSCHGSGLVEIKCLYSIRDSTPSADNLPYLHLVNAEPKLKRNSNYYFQIQGQMGVTGKLYTDFVVFTYHGTLIRRINFDPEFWEGMLAKLELFWMNCLCPELLTEEIKQNGQNGDTSSLPSAENNSSIQIISRECIQSKERSPKEARPVLKTIQNSDKNQEQKKREAQNISRKKVKQSKIYLCGICQRNVVDNPQQFSEESIQCDKCPLWNHFVCVGITEHSKPTSKTKWYCNECRN